MKNGDEDEDLEKITKADLSLEGNDYIALAIAALETLLLPLLILIIVIVIVALLLR